MPKNRFNPHYRKEVFGDLNTFNYRVCGDRSNNGTDVPCVGCVCSDSGCTALLNSPQMLQAENRRIYNTSRIRSSEFMMNKAAFNVFAGRGTSKLNNWNQSSDRLVAGIPKAIVPTRSSSVRGTKTGIRPGSQAPGGSGVDIKHNSYDRYLLRKKGRAMKAGPYVGDKVDANAVVNNKVQATNSLGLDCDCSDGPDGPDGRSIIIGNLFSDDSRVTPVFWQDPTSRTKSRAVSSQLIPNELELGSFTDGELNILSILSINASGQIIGDIQVYDLKDRLKDVKPLFWSSPTSVPIEIVSSDFTNLKVTSINNLGQLVGTGQKNGLNYNLFWSSSSDDVTELIKFNVDSNPVIEAHRERVFSINNLGNIVGIQTTFADGNYSHQALYWSSPTDDPIPLSLTEGSTEYTNVSFGSKSLNDRSEIVANVRVGDVGPTFPAYWESPSAQIKILDYNGYLDGEASSINVLGEIVGSVYVSNTAGGRISFPAYWDSSTANVKVLDRNGYDGGEALSINASGEIVGYVSKMIEDESNSKEIIMLEKSEVTIISESGVDMGNPPMSDLMGFLPARWSSPNASVEILELLPGTLGGVASDIQ